MSLGSTAGWRAADGELAESLRRAGASVAVEPRARRERCARSCSRTSPGRARRALPRAVALGRYTPRATIYSTTTAALLWPARGAIRFDAPAAANRPGRHGLWQRPLERRRLADSPLLLPMSEGALAESPPTAMREPVRSCCRCRSSARGPRRPSATSPRSPTRATREEANRARARRVARARRRPSELVVAGCTRAQLERAA